MSGRQEAPLRHELNQATLLTGDSAARLLAVAEDCQRSVKVGCELLGMTERTPEQEQDVFKFERKMIHGIVKRVDMLFDKSVEGHIEIGLNMPTEDYNDSLSIDHAQSCARW